MLDKVKEFIITKTMKKNSPNENSSNNICNTKWKFLGAYAGNDFEIQNNINADTIEWFDKVIYLKEPIHNKTHKCMTFKVNSSVYASCEVSMNVYMYFIYNGDIWDLEDI